MNSDKPLCLHIFPNPIKQGDPITIVTGADVNEDLSLIIYDLQGQKVYSFLGNVNSQITIDTDLKRGIYFVKTQSERFTDVQRVEVR